MSYSTIEIVNSTDYPIAVEISYMPNFCNDHDFIIQPQSTRISEKCIWPVTEIQAFVITPAAVFLAKPFISIGTTHHLFEVIHTADCNFRVVKMKNVKAQINRSFCNLICNTK